MTYPLQHPDIENRFLPSDNWRIENFNNPETKRSIFYRTAFIDAPKAIVFILPGLSEFGEKYIETTRELNAKGYNVVIIDWAYQGLSTRDLENPHKRSSDGAEKDLSDLEFLINDAINSPLPHYMLAHSMGGNYGLRYISQNPKKFKAASFSAPMLGIAGVCRFRKLTKSLLTLLRPIQNMYVPGGHDWDALDRADIINNVYSHDEQRREVHNAWLLNNPDLQIGSVTYKWLSHNLKSIAILAKPSLLSKINIPIYIGLAEKDIVVDNDALIRAAKYLPNAELDFLNEASHEILMEKNESRNIFLNRTFELFEKNT